MIREQVLRALALNREPGFHFAGNFAEVSFDTTADDAARALLPGGAHVTEAGGEVCFAMVAMLVDMALSASIRAGLHPATRMATVSMALQLTGERLEGPLAATARFESYLGAGEARQALARATLANAAGGAAAIAHGAFMPLEPPPGVAPFALPRVRREAPVLAARALEPAERAILRRADKALAAGEAGFIGRFLGLEAHATARGAACTMAGGAHVANRVGHAQGGLLMGLAAQTASATLPQGWALSAVNAFFVGPGVGTLRAHSRVIHRGLATAVVRTEVSGPRGRRVLEATTSHARR